MILNQVKLPDKPSELITLALRDMELCENDKLYRVDMNRWHFQSGRCCHVCLAGSVLAKTFDAPPTAQLYDISNEISTDTNLKLDALNAFRLGLIHTGLTFMNLDCPPSIRDDKFIRSYGFTENSQIGFKEDMREMVKMLQSESL